MTETTSKVFFILKKKAITSVYHIIKSYVFVIYRVEPVSPKKKKPEMMKQIKIINVLKRSKF